MHERAPVAATPEEARDPQWLTRREAAAFTQCSTSSVRHAARRGELRTRTVPANGQVLYNSHDLAKWRTRVSRNADQLKPALEAISQGASPLELVTQFGFEPDRARKLVEDWAWLGGAWLIEGPRGSREAWLRAYSLDDITPALLRRALETLCSIPWLAHFVRGGVPFTERSYYLGGASHELERARVVEASSVLDALGYTCTHRWWEQSPHVPCVSASSAQKLSRESLEGVRAAQLFVLLEPRRKPRREAYVELGVALERSLWSGQRIIVVDQAPPRSAFFEARGVERVSSLAELRAHLGQPLEVT